MFEDGLERGPRNIEQREALTKIRLTKKGMSYFKKFYLNRPIPVAIEDENIYVFNTSIDNLFVYFSRFGKEAYVIQPEYLQARMKKFHKKAYTLYENQE